MIPVPAGSVVLSDRRTQRRWEVAVDAFRLADVPVTQALYAEVTGEWPSGAGPGARRPVESVSWWDAVRFCNALSRREGRTPAYRLDDIHWERGADGYRLPTEAEWEYACRAGTTTVFHYGDDLDSYKANFNGLIYAAYGKAGAGPFFRSTVRVGDYPPNAWGLYDMHGNVQEWVADWYAADYYGNSPKEDPPGPAAGIERVLRGGGWPNSGKALRSAVRNKLAPDEKHYSAGFRVVLVAK